jgi:uroporphyrinogen-III synthase
VILFTGLDPSNFRMLGDLLHWPALCIAPDPKGYAALPSIIATLGRKGFDWLVFTSKVGVGAFFAALVERGLDARITAGTRVVAAGAGTADKLRERSVRADSVPAEPGSRGILSALGHLDGARILLVQGSHAPADLERAITGLGGRVTHLALHRVAPHPELGRPLPGHDVVYFVSPSGVRAYRHAYGAEAFRREIWCIGKATLAELNKVGLPARIVEPYVSSEQNAKIATQ